MNDTVPNNDESLNNSIEIPFIVPAFDLDGAPVIILITYVV